MVLSRAVYDGSGFLVFEPGIKLGEEHLTKLISYGVGEIMIEDWRVIDVPVQPLIAPELEAEAVLAIRQLMSECRGSQNIESSLLETVAKPIYAMARNLFPEGVGEPNASGCMSPDDFECVQPVKAVGLCLLIGKKLGFRMITLSNLGIAAIFMNIGYLMRPLGSAEHPEYLSDRTYSEFHDHPMQGAELLSKYGHFGPEVVEAVLQHHERWDGDGHPAGLKGYEIGAFARILTVVDAYYDLVSNRPCRKALMPHEAIEFIMSYSGELFDPDMVQILAREVPLYPTGISVKLNTGEVGIVTNANLGHIGRPVVRICYDENLTAVKQLYDLDLSWPEHQGRLIVQVLEY